MTVNSAVLKMTGYDPESGHISINGHEIYYEKHFNEKTENKDKAVILLHEGLGSAQFWRGYPAFFMNNFNLPVIVYDRRGYGKSSAADWAGEWRYMHDEALKILPALISKLGLNKVILTGHSDGGSIALLHAAAFPDITDTVIAIAPHYYREDKTKAGLESTVRSYESGGLDKMLKKYHGDKYRQVFHNWSDTWLSDDFARWDLSGELAAISCPALLIQCEEDEYASVSHIKDMEKLITGAKAYIIEGKSHSPHIKFRHEVMKMIKSFLKSQNNL